MSANGKAIRTRAADARDAFYLFFQEEISFSLENKKKKRNGADGSDDGGKASTARKKRSEAE